MFSTATNSIKNPLISRDGITPIVFFSRCSGEVCLKVEAVSVLRMDFGCFNILRLMGILRLNRNLNTRKGVLRRSKSNL